LIHSVDSPRLVDEIQKRAAAAKCQVPLTPTYVLVA
jgi:hypothetical protein